MALQHVKRIRIMKFCTTSPIQLGMTNKCFATPFFSPKKDKIITKKDFRWSKRDEKRKKELKKIHYHVPALLVLFAKTCFTWIALLTLPELLALSVDPTLIQEMLAHLKRNAWMTVGVVNQMQSCWSVASPASDIYSRLFYTLAYHVCTSCIWNVSICMSIYLSVWFRCTQNACRVTIDFATLT